MRQKNLYLMCGTPGSGKSTWISNRLKISDGICISRDAVRFSLLGDNDDYFSQEDEVFSMFLNNIQQQINGPENYEIYIDATHLNEKSRNRVVDHLDLENCSLTYVWFDVPLDICLERNELRNGRAYVPKSVIRRMFYQQTKPTNTEKYNHSLLIVNEKGEESIG